MVTAKTKYSKHGGLYGYEGLCILNLAWLPQNPSLVGSHAKSVCMTEVRFGPETRFGLVKVIIAKAY